MLVRQSLASEEKPQTAPHPNPDIQSFWDLGVEIRSTGTPGIFHPHQTYAPVQLSEIETNQHLADELYAFITASAQSQAERELQEPVSIEQYLTRRQDNAGVYPLLALI